jgi:hypothetical protein
VGCEVHFEQSMRLSESRGEKQFRREGKESQRPAAPRLRLSLATWEGLLGCSDGPNSSQW